MLKLAVRYSVCVAIFHITSFMLLHTTTKSILVAFNRPEESHLSTELANASLLTWFCWGVVRSHSCSHDTIIRARDSHGRHSYFRSSRSRDVLHNSSVPLRDDVGSFSASVVLENGWEKERFSPRRPPHIQDGCFPLWMFHPPEASLPTRPIDAMSYAKGFLPVVQQQLDGVPAVVAYNERVPVDSVPVAAASFSPWCSSLVDSTHFMGLWCIISYQECVVHLLTSNERMHYYMRNLTNEFDFTQLPSQTLREPRSRGAILRSSMNEPAL